MGWSTTSLSIMLIGYVILCFVMMYLCMIADPSESTIAYQFQIALPNKVWNKLSQTFGKEKMNVLQHVMDRALVLVYFVVVGGSWSVVFWYLYPWLYQSPGVSNVHGVIGVLVFLACFVSWGIANSSHPGKITAASFKRYDHYPYDNLLFLPDKRCETTKLVKVPRSKFDRIKYQCIVPRYDHFCGWTYNTYGEENYRWFLLFLGQHVAMCFYGSFVSMLLFRDEIRQKKMFELTFFDRSTGETVKAGYSILLQYLFARRTLECCVLTIMFVMGIALSFFSGYHVRNRQSFQIKIWTLVTLFHIFIYIQCSSYSISFSLSLFLSLSLSLSLSSVCA
jgi:palmitoyltransferase